MWPNWPAQRHHGSWKSRWTPLPTSPSSTTTWLRPPDAERPTMLALLAITDEATPNGAWFPHDVNEVIWGTIAFVLVMALLVWKAGPAIKKAMNGRTERIQSELDVA